MIQLQQKQKRVISSPRVKKEDEMTKCKITEFDREFYSGLDDLVFKGDKSSFVPFKPNKLVYVGGGLPYDEILRSSGLKGVGPTELDLLFNEYEFDPTVNSLFGRDVYLPLNPCMLSWAPVLNSGVIDMHLPTYVEQVISSVSDYVNVAVGTRMHISQADKTMLWRMFPSLTFFYESSCSPQFLYQSKDNFVPDDGNPYRFYLNDGYLEKELNAKIIGISIINVKLWRGYCNQI